MSPSPSPSPSLSPGPGRAGRCRGRGSGAGRGPGGPVRAAGRSNLPRRPLITMRGPTLGSQEGELELLRPGFVERSCEQSLSRVSACLSFTRPVSSGSWQLIVIPTLRSAGARSGQARTARTPSRPPRLSSLKEPLSIIQGWTNRTVQCALGGNKMWMSK